MRDTHRVILACLLALSAASAGAQELRLAVMPGVMIPLGANGEHLGVGGGGSLAAEYGLPFLPLLYTSLRVGYEMLPAPLNTRLSMIDAGVALGARFWVLPWLTLRAQAGAGYYESLLPFSGGLESGGGFSAEFALLPEAVVFDTLRVSLGPAYVLNTGLHGGLRVQAGASFSLGSPGRKGARGEVAMLVPEFEPVFPVYRKRYEQLALGKAELRNTGSAPVTDVAVRFFVKQFMDAPLQVSAASRLSPGQAIPIEFKALFNDRILEYTEATLVTAEVLTEYTRGGRRFTANSAVSLRVENRNAMHWTDDRSAAAFVTVRDPAVLAFARAAAGAVPAGALDRNLATALALHEALDLFGIRYLVDPKTPYIEYSKNPEAVDFLLFPRQTLDYKSGDCDDLSILYAAALEGLGIETAFITVPGHIYLAFALAAPAEEARRLFPASAGDLLIRDGRAWAPLEVTLRSEGFIAAWALGARQWREAEAKGNAAFIDLREAWKLYEPVQLPGAAVGPASPPPQALAERYKRELGRLAVRELEPTVAKFQAELKSGGENPRLLNSLGLAYARFGVYDKARQAFSRAVAREEFVPALLNLGNLALLEQKLKEAGELYTRALTRSPGNASALLGLARVSHEQEDYGRVRQLYAQLQSRDPKLAQRFAYLEQGNTEAARAAGAEERQREAVWQD
jgi:tetratricopeptide (TPR) repeat protein